MICPRCKSTNDENSAFCENCGAPLKNSSNISNQTIFIGIIAIIIIIVVIGVGLLIALSNNNSNDNSIDLPNNNILNTNTPSWHKINSYNGVDDNVITINTKGNKLKIVSTAMPIMNYDENYMLTTVSNYGNTLGFSELSWDDNSAVASKTANIEFTSSGTCYIYISTYDIDYWNIEIYEWY
ncbi:MAG: zinc ribbon domain-containing protein [Methanobrevibacter sp.]|nr:zinc ribbon domain-containing protein [Methanobrevibacter sp.]